MGSEPTSPAGVQPAPTLYCEGITGNAGPAAAPGSVRLLAAANSCITGASEAPAHMCCEWSLQLCLVALTAWSDFPDLMLQQG